MAVTAENNAWAVGGYDDANNRRQSIAYYWDGSTWGAFAVPSPGLYGSLSSVASLVANNAWAVGDYYDGSCTCSLSLVTHFDGSTWTQVSVPNPSSIENTLGAVALSPDGTAWAVGEYRDPGCNCYQSLVLHFDGSSWVVVNVATPGISSSLYSISTTDANNAWAVGWYFDGSHSHTLTLHWDGSSWQTVPSPDLGINDHLNGVYNSSDGTAWAVGQYMDAQGTERAMTMHWDGSAWSTVVAPSPFYGSHLTSVVSNSPTDAWSAGVYAGADGNYRPMLYHWDGSSWTDLGSPYSGNGTSDCLLSSIVRLNSSYIWAGGSCNGETMTFRYSSQ